MTEPTVSVVLPFYRNPLVVEAVKSILDQGFGDFELIAIDDCSGNGVADLLRSIDDPRFRLVERETNGGENVTRNHGISLARGKYIAFQDHDDVSYPERLALQVAFLEAHPEVLGCGTACHYGEDKVLHGAPLTMGEMWWEMIFNNHVMFPTVMVRTEVARRHPFGDLVATDDYRWLYQVMHEGAFVNIPEVTFHYRMQATSLSMSKAELQLNNLDIYRSKFAAAAGVDCSEDEVRVLRWLGTPRAESWPMSDLRTARSLLERLVSSFSQRHPEAKAIAAHSAASRLRYATTVSALHGISAWSNWNTLRGRLGQPMDGLALKLAAKCLVKPFARRLRS